MRRFYCFIIALVASSCTFYGQSESSSKPIPFEPVESKFPIQVSGYVKHESYWDTRQVFGARADQTLLFPEKKKLDSNCNDINAQGQYEMVAIQSRMRFSIFGPQIKHAKTHGVIEFDFFGKDGINNIIRMRHAHLFLTWEKVEMLAGQAYHPLYVLYECEPRTLSFNTGIPMETFSRNPQFRITWTPSPRVNFIFCASTELDFPSDGPDGLDTKYMRDAVVPMLDFQMQTHFSEHLFGFGIDYKRIRPRLETLTGVKANETLNSIIVIAYNALNWESFNTRTKFMFVQNPTDQNMTGGYAVHSVDPINDRRTYTNLNGIALWNDSDITKSKSVIPGWFIGFIKNIGSRKTILQNVVDSNDTITDKRIFGIGTDLDYVFRVSPRIQWQVNNFMFGVEVEYTRAAFGTIDCDGKVINTDPVGNTRLLVTLYYYL